MFLIVQRGVNSRSLEVVEVARDRGIGVVVGAQVGETSILSRAALTVAAAAGDQLLGQEGAFGTNLLRDDFTEPLVMFSRSGRLAVGTDVDASIPGLGLKQNRPLS